MISHDVPRDHVAYALAAAAAVAATAILERTDPPNIKRYLGRRQPALVAAAVSGTGYLALRFLEARGFTGGRSRSVSLRDVAKASGVAIPLAAAAIAVDIAVGFPKDMNVGWPRSAVFYPTVAVLAEAAFHLIPLAAVVWVTDTQFAERELDRRTTACIAASATVEPAFQAAYGSALAPFVIPHVFVVGSVQLVVLRLSDYLPMLAFRLAYYLIWHVLWGAARLRLRAA